MHRPSLVRIAALSAAAAAAPTMSAVAQQSQLSVSPFVSLLPSGGASPLAGLAMTLGGTQSGFALRGSGNVALQNSNVDLFSTGETYRPWGADADAMFFLAGRGSYRPTLAPYVFAGIGTASTDSDGFADRQTNWSYGAGLQVPLGGTVDLFGESRWRMSQFLLPTAKDAFSPTMELRFGLTFHLGAGGGSNRMSYARDRRSALPVSYPGDDGYPVATVSSASAARILGTADEFLGVPYRYGGTSPNSGFDCSGFTQFVFARQGVRLPRTAREQAEVGEPLAPNWRMLSPGDLVMFDEGGRIGHVAIYAGHGRIIHSTSSGGGVQYDDLTTQRGQWFVDHMVAARRVTPNAHGALLDLAAGFVEAGIQLDGPDHAPRR